MKVKIINTYVDNLEMKECIKKIDNLINDGGYHYVVTPNVDHIVKLETDSELQAVYESADLVVADGMPLVWYSKILKTPLKEKISGSDLFPELCKLAERKNYKIFLLGAGPGVADLAAKRIREKHPRISSIGTYSPSYGFENNNLEIEKIVSIIRDFQPDILAVGLGAPKQEKFIYKYREILKVPVSLAIGATIDFQSGVIKRAPRWMQKSGLEWLYRLIKEPRRMYKRYLIDDMAFLKLVYKDIAKKG